MISVVIPVIDAFEVTQECIDTLLENSLYSDIEVIVIDNGSDENITAAYYSNPKVTVQFNKENIGLLQSLRLGITLANHELVLYIHNDVFIHEIGWDVKIKVIFDELSNVAIGGFFGSRGVEPNGARIHAESNMLGKKYGSGWKDHGHHLTWCSPASTLDGLGMIFRRSVVLQEGLPDMPPHHWYDRILPLYFIEKGYDCISVGVGFDHWGGITSCKSEKYFEFAKKWCEERGLQPPKENPNSWDAAIYCEGALQFYRDWSPKLPLVVNIKDGQFVYTWSHNA